MCFHEWMTLSSYEWLSIRNKVRKKPFSFGLILYWIEILSWIILTDLKWLWKMKMLEVARSNMLEIQLKKKLHPLVKRLLLYNKLFGNLLLGYLLNSDIRRLKRHGIWRSKKFNIFKKFSGWTFVSAWIKSY